jgi:hypothetical protein
MAASLPRLNVQAIPGGTPTTSSDPIGDLLSPSGEAGQSPAADQTPDQGDPPPG